GLVFPCCLADGRAVMGDLATESLLDVWRGERFGRFRADLAGGTELPAICRSCTAVRRVGPHPVRYAGVLEGLEMRGTTLRVVVRTTGLAPWTRNWPLAIGRVGDRSSTLSHPSWAAPNRIAYMTETEVPPGRAAVVEREVSPGATGTVESFSALVEGVA